MPPSDDQVRFENQGDEFGAPPQRGGGMDLSAALVRSGLVSSAEQAQYVLVGIAVLIFLFAGYFFFRSGGGSAPPPPPPNMAPSALY